MPYDTFGAVGPDLGSLGASLASERLERWRRARRRVLQLEAVFQDEALIADLIRRDRYLKLCALIAWAHEVADRARPDIEDLA